MLTLSAHEGLGDGALGMAGGWGERSAEMLSKLGLLLEAVVFRVVIEVNGTSAFELELFVQTMVDVELVVHLFEEVQLCRKANVRMDDRTGALQPFECRVSRQVMLTH